MAAAYYRLLSPAGDASEEGNADVVVRDGAFVLTPKAGDVLRVPFSQIASIQAGEQFTLLVALAQGTVVELSRLGVMRTQLLAEMRDAHAATAAKNAAVVGTADAFKGECDGQPVDLRIYDDALLVIGPAGSERISFSFVKDVTTSNYVVTVEVTGRGPVTLARLANRTGEFCEALRKRLSAARGRTSAFLGALLPGLDPMALRQAAGLLRDGVAVPVGTLNGIHEELADTLIAVSALPDRRDGVAELGRRGDLAIGFRQIVSVHREAVGVTPWQDHAVTPNIGGHESPGGSFGTGFGGMLAAGMMAGGYGPGGFLTGGFGAGGAGGYAGGMPGGGPFGFGAGYGGYGDLWAFRALGAGLNSGQQRPMVGRADVTRGRLTPATEDLSALTTAGDDPTVLAFVLASTADRVVFEVLNLREPVTLVFRKPGPDGLAVINRALVDIGFTEPAGSGVLTAPAGRPAVLAESLIGQVPHDAQWSTEISRLLS